MIAIDVLRCVAATTRDALIVLGEFVADCLRQWWNDR